MKMKLTLSRSLRRPRKSLPEVYGWLRLRAELALWRDLAPAAAKSASTGCRYHTLFVLFRHVVRHRPAYVLELGAGLSTVVLAHAARRVREAGAPCTIVSMEEHPFYYDELKRFFPASVADCVELVLSPIEERKVENRIALCYASKPRHAYNLVFIDGPQVPKDESYFDGDILDALLWNDNAFTAYLDGRSATRESLVRFFPWAKVSFNHEHKFTRFEFPERSARRLSESQ